MKVGSNFLSDINLLHPISLLTDGPDLETQELKSYDANGRSV